MRTDIAVCNPSLRVLHVLPAVAPRYGGPSTAIWPMAEALQALGVEVEIASTDVDGPGRVARSVLPPSLVPVHLMSGVRELSAWLGTNVGKFDLIHTHSLWNRHVGAACRAARRAGVPYLVRPCGMLSSYTWRRSPWKKRAYWFAVERRNVLRAAGLHATSETEASDVRRCGVRAPVEVIPLGVGPEGLAAPRRPDWLRAKCGPAARELPIILFLSRLHPKKGVTDFLLPAFARLRSSAYLAVAGGVDDSTPKYGAEVERVMAELGLVGGVSLIGPVAPADRFAAYDGAAVFCLPSQSENFGVVVAEAMARGCPVVASEGVDAATHAVAAGAGYRVPLDVDALAKALDATLADANAIGRRGPAYVAAHLGWPAVAEKILEFYQRVLPARPDS